MKRLLLFVFLMVAVSIIWYLLLLTGSEKFSLPLHVSTIDEMFNAINSLFIALVLAGLVYVCYQLSIDMQTNQQTTLELMQSSRQHLEVVALTSLIQECDLTLHRYDRWEEAGIKGDYANAKASVRDKMNAHRERLEKKLLEIQDAKGV